jgi:hypothetical protein
VDNPGLDKCGNAHDPLARLPFWGQRLAWEEDCMGGRRGIIASSICHLPNPCLTFPFFASLRTMCAPSREPRVVEGDSSGRVPAQKAQDLNPNPSMARESEPQREPRLI